MTEIDWNEWQAALAQLECDVSPAGAHGQMAALACRLKPPPEDYGLATSATDEDAWGTLRTAYLQIEADLASADLNFSPLLPDDGEALWRRLEGLAEWAECFAFGLSLGGGFDPSKLGDDAHECLEHLLEISRLDPDDSDIDGPEGEEALVELVEFLRVAVMTLYVELRTLDASPSNTVH